MKKDIDRNWEAQRQKDTYKKFDRANYERYAAESASPVLPRAKKLAARAKSVQEALGDHQDSVVARSKLRQYGAQRLVFPPEDLAPFQQRLTPGHPFVVSGRGSSYAAAGPVRLKDLWGELPDSTHREVLEALGRVVARHLQTPTAKPEVAHEHH